MRNTRRLNLDLGPNSFEALKRLQETLETASQAETIRLALQTLAKLVDEVEHGGRALIERTNGEKVEIVLPSVRRATATVTPLRRLKP